jgi:RimJ/RimL family protein N-acetyltransferase
MLEHLNIRPAKAADAAAYRAHMLAILAEPRIDTPYMPDEYPRTEEEEAENIALYTALDNALFLLAVTPDDAVAGSLRLLGGTLRAVRHAADLALYVSAPYRGQGVGRRLMEVGLDWARRGSSLRRIQLEVYARNTSAIRLYQSLGFVVEGRRVKAVFQDDEFLDELLMGLVW